MRFVDDPRQNRQDTDEVKLSRQPRHWHFLSFSGSWPTTFQALRHRNFQLFWTGQLISLIGTWMQSLAQQWLVNSLARSEFHVENTSLYLGFVSMVGSLPLFFFSLFGGVIADRRDKRRLLILTQSCFMLLAFALAFLAFTGKIRLWHVMVFATLSGTIMALDMPTRQSFVKDLVGPRDLLNAIALNSSIFNGARIIGPAVAGFLIGLRGIGVPGAFFLNGVSYIAVIAGLWCIRIAPAPRPSTGGSVWEELKEGFRYVIRHRTIRLLMILMGVYVFGFAYVVLMPVIAGTVLGHPDAGSLGILMSSTGAGALIGALLLATLAGRVRKGQVMLYAGLVFSVALAAFSFSRSFLLSALVLPFVGAGLILTSASINSLIQEMVPDRLRGRVISIWAFVFAGSTPITALYAGIVGHLATPTTPLLVGAIITIAAIGLLSLRAPWVWSLE